jgi:hypothetical protein
MSAHESSEFPTNEWLPIAKLFVDDQYQRDENERWVKKAATEFNADLFGEIVVSLRANGKYAVIDGQHRLALAAAVGMKTVPCLIHRGMDAKEEAGLFELLQKERRNLRPFDVFKSALFRGETWAVDCQRIVASLGLRVSPNVERGQTSSISGVMALQRTHAAGVEVLTAALTLMTTGWDDETPGRTDSALIEGFGAFVATHLGRYEAARVLRMMQGGRTPLSPEVLKFRAAAIASKAASSRNAAVHDGVASRRWSVLRALEDEYNRSIASDGETKGMLRKTRRASDKRPARALTAGLA